MIHLQYVKQYQFNSHRINITLVYGTLWDGNHKMVIMNRADRFVCFESSFEFKTHL